MRHWISTLLLLSVSYSSLALDIQTNTLYPRVEFDTSLGKVVIELDRARAPITVNNFLTYVVRGEYDNTIFHRVISDFVVQGGGLNTKQEELPVDKAIVNESGNGLTNSMGTIAMARGNEPHSATRQFFFNVADNPNLNPSRRGWGYTVFGEVVEGKTVIEAMAVVETSTNAKLNWPDVPITPIILKTAKLLPKK